MAEPHDAKSKQPDVKDSESPRVLNTRALFGDRREVWIEHDGERYCLRITRRNKLILRK
jgi:hemin uptake protein HemP